jgi:hypothetical protein
LGQAAHLSALKSVPIIWMVRINALSSPISYATSYIVYSSIRTLDSSILIWMKRSNALSSPISYATSYIVYSSMRTLDIWYVAAYNLDGAEQRLVLPHVAACCVCCSI